MKLEGPVRAVKSQRGPWHLVRGNQDESIPGTETVCNISVRMGVEDMFVVTNENKNGICQDCVRIAESQE